MANTALADNITYLKESGFSTEQAEGILQITHKQTKELLKGVQKKVDQTEQKMVTQAYLDLQVENIKKSLIIQVGGVMLSGLLLLGWYINHLDNKTRTYIEARFAQHKTRFEAQDTRFNDFKDNVNTRMDRMETDIKSIETDIKSIHDKLNQLLQAQQRKPASKGS